jgi:methanogenic corrinoid protein MtbC1
MLGRFADYFGVSFDFLLGRSEAPHGPAEVRLTDVASESGDQRSAAVSGLASQYLHLLQRNRVQEATNLIDAAARGGMGIRRIYLDVLEPALKETGRLWDRGELRVGEEHVISEATRRIMSRLFLMNAVPAHPPGSPRCVVLAAPGEQHTMGPRMVADFLRLDGWDVEDPGGNLGIRHVLEMLAAHAPEVVAVSATVAAGVAGAADLIATIREKPAFRTVRTVVGGQAFQFRPGLWQEIGADGTAADAESAVRRCNALVGRTSGAA